MRRLRETWDLTRALAIPSFGRSHVKKHFNLIVFVFWVAAYFLLIFPFANREVQAIIAVFGTTLVTRATKSFTDRGWQGLMFWKGEA